MSTLSEEPPTLFSRGNKRKMNPDQKKKVDLAAAERKQFALDMEEMFKDQVALCEQQFDEVLNPTVSITPPPHDPIDFDELDQF